MSKAPPIPWRSKEDDLLKRLFAEGLDDEAISEEIGRTVSAVQSRRRALRLMRQSRDLRALTSIKGFLRASSGPHAPTPDATPAAIAERDRAYRAPRTIGQDLMGEPLPGRSYLDRMKEREAQGERTKLHSHHSAWSPRAW